MFPLLSPPFSVDAHLVLLSASHFGLDLLDLFHSRHVGFLESLAGSWVMMVRAFEKQLDVQGCFDPRLEATVSSRIFIVAATPHQLFLQFLDKTLSASSTFFLPVQEYLLVPWFLSFFL